MGLIQAYRMAVKSIAGNKVRSFLTMLGVIIGVSAVIAAVAYAKGSTASITSKIQDMGTNLIQINIVGRGSNRNVTYENLLTFQEENSSTVAAIAPQTSGTATVKVGDKTRSTSLIGTNPDYEDVKSVHVQEGRFLQTLDVDLVKKVALVGTAVVNDVFNGSDPIGKDIKINGQVYKVVGVLQQTQNAQTSSTDDQIIIPVSSAQRLTKSSVIRNFSVLTVDSKDVSEVIDKLTVYLTKIYKSSKSFNVMNSEQILSTLNSVTSQLMILLGGIATISLVVGGIGIMNIMLVSVTERTKEIGIRKAIGARKKNILIQFLFEALMVTGIGGVLGVLIGVGIIKFILGGMKIVPEVYSIPWMLLSFGISLIVGVAFGMFPAYKAANLNPIEALRFE